MRCMKCKGRLFLDHVSADNRNLEVYCVLCGDRKFVSKSTELGKWLLLNEASLRH
jgi:hypothetical protein